MKKLILVLLLALLGFVAYSIFQDGGFNVSNMTDRVSGAISTVSSKISSLVGGGSSDAAQSSDGDQA